MVKVPQLKLITHINPRLGVIVCEHVASAAASIACGQRGLPVNQSDSGWAFFCNLDGGEDPQKARVWSVESVILHDPLLADLLELPTGTALIKQGGAWMVEATDGGTTI
jgi:hypothetical protein